MHTAKLGDLVRVYYQRVPNGDTPQASHRRMVEFSVGTSNMVPTISFGVVGMVQGERKRFLLQPREAYGPIRPRLINEIPRERFPRRAVLEVGQRFATVAQLIGHRRRVKIIEIRHDSVVVDANHPLAGKTVEVEVVMISVNGSSDANKTAPQFDLGGEA